MAMKENAANGAGQIANPRGLPLVKSFVVDPADNVTGQPLGRRNHRIQLHLDAAPRSLGAQRSEIQQR